MYMMNNQREDSEDGVDWEGWQGEGDTAQANLPNRVIRENVIQVKKHFGADQKSYLLNYFCWNPVGEVSKSHPPKTKWQIQAVRHHAQI